MRYKFLGKSGVKVSEIAFGVQTFGWCADEKAAYTILDRFVEAGGNLLDMADSYNEGRSEQIVGNWLQSRKHRDTLVIATKVFFPTGKEPNDTGLTRKHLCSEIDKSLKRLKTDYVDLYQLHCFDASTPLEETLGTLDDLVHVGKVRYIGASNFTASQLQKALMLSKMHRWNAFISLQPEYSLLVRSTEWELLPFCREEGLGLLPWSPLAGGWLTGKYRQNQPLPPDSRGGRKDRWDDQAEQRVNELTWRIIETLIAIGQARGKTPAQVALNWLMQQPGVTSPIVGARTLEQLDDNLGSIGWELSTEDIEKLNAASDVPRPYPYSFIERYTRKRI
ncbi:aldo/keto reductase [Candidatus Moduliflexus flocculans]|uniref:Aldo/keto reductase n=1 Tax=Candidatus Moduliflexus flocculans TaxID=1499966 RepID=A0A0S6VU81_9BACT|nr:aldo/keto reductase [Candidatus Moduliflexus flocculans]